MHRPPKPVCMSISTGKNAVLMRSGKKVARLIEGLLKDDNTVLVGQNIAFDLAVAWKWLGIDIGLIYAKHDKGLIADTMIRELLIDIVSGDIQIPNRLYSLDKILLRRLKVDKSHLKKGDDIWRLRYGELHGVPVSEYPQEAYDYALGDATDTLDVYLDQQAEMDELVNPAEELFQTASNWAAWLVGCMSPYVDAPRVAQFRKKHEKKARQFDIPFAEAGMLKWNPHRFKDRYPVGDDRRGGYSEVRKVMQAMIKTDYERRGLEVPMTEPSKTYENGQVSYSEETLIGCGSRALRRYGRASKDRKLVNTFVPMLEEAQGRRVMPMYNILVSTGRMSCRRPNMQQLPRAPGARECFVPPPGKVIACLDYSSVEMFGLAQVLYERYDSTHLLEVLNNEQDPHLMMVAKILGKDYQTVFGMYESNDAFVDKLRQLAKIINFGAGGGMGAKTFLSNMDEEVRDTLQALDPDEELLDILQDILLDWRDQWEMHDYFGETSRLTRKGRKFEYEQPWLGRVRGNLGYTDGNNERFQGRCADAFKNQMQYVMRDILTPGTYLHEKKVEYSGLMHDENVMMGPPDDLRKWTGRVRSIMVERAQEVLPDCKMRVDIQCTGNRWMKAGISVPEFEVLRDHTHDVESYLIERKKAAKNGEPYTIHQHVEVLSS